MGQLYLASDNNINIKVCEYVVPAPNGDTAPVRFSVFPSIPYIFRISVNGELLGKFQLGSELLPYDILDELSKLLDNMQKEVDVLIYVRNRAGVTSKAEAALAEEFLKDSLKLLGIAIVEAMITSGQQIKACSEADE